METRSLKLLLLLGLLGLRCVNAAPLPEATPESVGMSSERLAQMTSTLQRIIDAGDLPGVVVMVARQGKLVYHRSFGFRDRVAGAPLEEDAIFRIYSMTKPVVSVAAMILVEEGRLSLDEPIAKYLPEFKDMRVGVESFDPATGTPAFHTVPARRAITVQDLLRHTSGLTYGAFNGKAQVQKLYRESVPFAQDWTLESFTKALAKVPLLYEPGTTWEYGHSTDVLGRVVEVASGMALDRFLAERIFRPLGMTDTGFDVAPAKQGRIAQPQRDPQTGQVAELIDVTRKATFFAGGHGLVSTAGDYLRFAQMLANGGSLDGVRILGPRTVAFMTANHVGPNISPGLNFIPGPGYGFGLGFGVRTQPGLSEWPSSVGEFFWAGYAGTYFWVDPKEALVPVMMSQEVARRQHYRVVLRSLVYQALER